ncbi:MAG: hypothetical protein L3J31_00205 [Bacteroidales bacterium]|nr:hypothetical protein [Bacteroidales bacterium]
MKNIKIIIMLSLLFGFASVYSQQAQATKGNAVTRSSNTIMDPKLSPEEQSLILNAGKDNPAKIDESQLMDPKIDPATLPTEDDFGESNAKPEPTEDREEVKAPVTQPLNTKELTQSQTSQPEGEKPANVVNYRNMKGSKSQPKGKEPVNVINYRDMKGSKSQPLTPSKKDPNKLN